MYWEQTTPFNFFQTPPSSSVSQLYFFSLFIANGGQWLLPYVPGCGVIHWSLNRLPWATLLKKKKLTSLLPAVLTGQELFSLGWRPMLARLEYWLAGSCTGIVPATTAAVGLCGQWPHPIKKAQFPALLYHHCLSQFSHYLLPDIAWVWWEDHVI